MFAKCFGLFGYKAMFCVFQVADFGLAKIDSETNTHVSTRVMGTFGYLAPEYAQAESLMRSLTFSRLVLCFWSS